MSTTKSYRCYHCKKTKPLSAFYRRSDDGSVISGCKTCHRKIAAARRNGLITPSEGTPPAALLTASIVTTPTTAPLSLWRCESCGRPATTYHPAFPRGWKKLAGLLIGDPKPAELCSKCSKRALEGARVLRAVLQRRTSRAPAPPKPNPEVRAAM